MISLPEHAFSMENLHRAYLKCRRGKRGSMHTRGFEVVMYREIEGLSVSLMEGMYRPSRSVCFYVTKPKLREIFAAHFRDRVVHRLLVDILEPHYERVFIYDSYACRKGKGTHRAVERLREFVQRGTKNGRGALSCLQLDIKGFFMRVNRRTLLGILSKRIHDPRLLDLCATVVLHDPTANFVFRGRRPGTGTLPPHKTLFHGDGDRGIPIGNLTSQFFANVYLNELDQFIKRALGARYYLRYADDFLLLHENPRQLLEWKNEIERYLREKLSLELKEPGVVPVSVYRGIDFLGYFVKPRYTLVRRRVMRNMNEALGETLPGPPGKSGRFLTVTYHPEMERWKRFQSRINSYLAHMHRANTRGAVKRIEERIAEYYPVLEMRKGYVRLIPLHFGSFRRQADYFGRCFPRHLLIFQVGRFYEMCGHGAREAAGRAGAMPFTRGGAAMYGVPARALPRVMRAATGLALPLVLFRQSAGPSEGVRPRYPVLRRELLEDVQLGIPFGRETKKRRAGEK